ncbi:MAG: hypothetical protein JST04_00980 [Bdellovibrionales bacterium]|nr:hypothetical protein [Bdellovibrionales bacterium]
MEKLIKVGSKVKFRDGSYTLTIKANSTELTHEYEGLREEVCTVVAVNVLCPSKTSHHNQLYNSINNCIVKAPNGDIIFCQKLNIEGV